MKDKLTSLLGEFDKYNVECDGFVRISSAELVKAKIDHNVLVGCVYFQDDFIPFHVWIEVKDEDGEVVTVDYRLRMWLGDSAPHGVFYNKDVDYRIDNELEVVP